MVGSFLFAGSAGVASVSAKTVWTKIYGACPAMPLPGSARTVAHRMDSVTSEDSKICGEAKYGWILSRIRI